MHILLTNDDGIYAPGIQALHQALTKVARVTVSAPEMERSSVGHGITLAHPLWAKKVDRNKKFFGYAVSGTPADCVKFGLKVLLKEKPDLVVSGINLGTNDGCSLFYSGTVAGAREGALMGVPAMAISLDTFEKPDFRAAADFAAKLAAQIVKNKLPKKTFLNVNVPHLPSSKIKGVKVVKHGTAPIHATFSKRKDPFSRDYYWMSGRGPAKSKDLSNDTSALNAGYITVVPIHCDMTAYDVLEDIKSWKL